ncbi:MAG: MFS transporter [Verrucomicrobia bacterium]|nr:MFS transporter [Verrucomicrobiota bacterium]
MYDLGLTSFEFSLLSSALFLIVYGTMQIPVGLIVDNIGLKKSLFVGALVCSIAAFGLACSYSYPVAVFYRMLMGFGASFGFICLLMAVNDWIPRRYSAIFIGLSQFIGTLGPMIAAGPLHVLAESSDISWRNIFFVLGYIGLAVLALITIFVKNNKQHTERFVILRRPEKIKYSIMRLFSRQPWYIAIVSAGLFFTIEYLSENEGRTFLSLKGCNVAFASYMVTLSWFGYALGCPILGLLSDLIQRRKSLLTLCALFGTLSIVTIVYSTNKNLLSISFFILGVSASGQTIGFAIMAEQFKKQFIALGFGLNNAVITIIAAINAPAIGFVLDYVKKEPQIALSEYQSVFTILIALALITFVISRFFIKETYCKSAMEFTLLKRENRPTLLDETEPTTQDFRERCLQPAT